MNMLFGCQVAAPSHVMHLGLYTPRQNTFGRSNLSEHLQDDSLLLQDESAGRRLERRLLVPRRRGRDSLADEKGGPGAPRACDVGRPGLASTPLRGVVGRRATAAHGRGVDPGVPCERHRTDCEGEGVECWSRLERGDATEHTPHYDIQ